MSTKQEAVKPEFHPAPGYVLAKPMTREELAKSSTSLVMPDNAGKEKDAVGVATVIETGPMDLELAMKLGKLPLLSKADKAMLFGVLQGIEPGDLIAYMPFSDMIIMDGFEKRNLVSYKAICAVAKKQ